jgi:hypothetical protein
MLSTNKQLDTQNGRHSVCLIHTSDEKVPGLVSGVVLNPCEVDAQGDWVSPKEIERAAHDYIKNARGVGVEHKDREGARVVESYIAQGDWKIQGELVKKGAWILVMEITDEALWNRVESHELTGFSIEGTAQRILGTPEYSKDR